MSVVRGRPPAFAGGMSGSIKRYWSSLSACPEPKSPTSARSSGVHIGSLQRGCPMRTVTSHIHRRPSTAYSDLSKRAVSQLLIAEEPALAGCLSNDIEGLFEVQA